MLSATGAVPATRQVVGTTIVGGNEGPLAFQWSVAPLQTWQSVGFDVSGTRGAVVRLASPVVADAASLAACREPVQAALPKYQPLKRVESRAPVGVCVMDNTDKRRWGATQLGQCFCPEPFTGSACDAPAVDTPEGKISPGVDGYARSPVDGSLIRTTTDPVSGEAGTFCFRTSWTGYPETRCHVKTMDKGRIIRTKLLQLTSDYGRVFRLDPTYGETPFADVAVPATATGGFVNRKTADGIASVRGYVASFVSPDELRQYVAVAASYLSLIHI